MQRIIRTIRRLPGSDLTAQRAKKGLSSLLSMLFTLLLCFSLPAAQASDREIYTTASGGNITLMLTLDQSLSMSGSTACDLPQGYALYRYNSAATGTYAAANFDNKYAAKHAGVTFNTRQNYCTAYPPIIKYKRYYDRNGNFKYAKCTNNVAIYENCIWGAELAAQPSVSTAPYTGLYYLNGTGYPGNRRNVTVFYSRVSTPSTEKFYTRIGRVQNAIYELMYGPNAIDNDKTIGLAVFSYYDGTTLESSKGSIRVPARKLNTTGLAITSTPQATTSLTSADQRFAIMQAAAAMTPMGATPLLNVYADVASYLLGTNTIRKPLQNLKYVQRIAWKECEYHKADNRTADGSCKDWSPSGSNANDSYNWDRFDLPYTHFDANSLVELDIAACTRNNTTPAQLTGISACYGVRRILPRYASALPVDETDETRRVWRTCTKWDETGDCQTDSLDWRTSDTATTTTWNSTKPNDPRLDDSSPNRYGKISITEYRCPSSGYITGSTVIVSDNTHNLTCYGDEIDVPVFAVKRITTAQTPATSNIAWGTNGVWKTCNTNQTDGSCRTADYVPNGVNLTATGWSNVAPASTNLENTEASFCSNVTQLEIPGNNTGYAGICYYADDSSIYAPMTSYQYYSGFLRSVRASKVNANSVKSPATNTDTVANAADLQNTYDPPPSIKAQINDPASRQCGGQAIYMLTDGQQNSSGLTISRRLYRSALTSDSTPSLTAAARTFNCRSAIFGGTNTVWSCAANFSRYLLDDTVTPIRSSIKTAAIGFGDEYNEVPKYDSTLSQTENAALIQDSDLGYNVKNFALLGIYGQGGWYRGSSTDDVVNSVNDVLDKLTTTAIPALNSGTVTIPVDALNPTQIQNYGYYPEYQPRPDITYPLWLGNLKKFKVLNGVFVDKNNENILNRYGVPRANLSDLWQGTDALAGALGKLQLRGTQSRTLVINQVYNTQADTYDATTAGSSTNDGLMTITSDHLASADSNRGYLLALLGYSVTQTQADAPSQIDATILNNTPVLRQMGAAVHSSPILLTQSGRVNFDTSGNAITDEGSRDEYVAFGTQQGLFQVVNTTTGIEKFAFVPYEMLQRQKKGFLDKSLVTDASGIYYGIDAPWTAYTEYVSKGDNLGTLTVGTGVSSTNATGVSSTQGKQWVYGGLRMGGRSYYSLDLGDMNTPKLKFWINPAGAAAGTPLSYMGQSWSKPTLAYVNWKGARKLVMLVGGGYDPGYESDSYNQVNGQGAGVYMFDADNGNLLWWVSNNPSASTNTGATGNALKVDNMSYSVTSRINTLDRDSDGLVDALYFADLGGQVWRVDINNNAAASVIENDKPNVQFATRAVRLLNLHTTATVNGSVIGVSPRFYEAPSIGVYSDPSAGKFVAIAVGSGNRSQPYTAQYAPSVANGRTKDAIYVVYDKDIARTNLYTIASSALNTNNLVLANLIENTNKVTGTAASYANNGWYYRFSTIKSSEVNNIQNAKVIGETTLINKNLYVPVYDAAQDGVAGTCGTGIKGATIAHRFCLPFGKCAVLGTDESNELYLGSGISGINVGVGSTNTSLRVIGGVCTGSTCSNIGGGTTNKSLLKSEHSINRVLMPKQWYKPNARP